jgi:DNA mismatch repair protein MutS2
LQSVRRAREELRAAQARLRSGRADEAALRAVSKAIDSVAHKTSIGGELEPRSQDAALDRPAVDPKDIRVGTRIYVPRIRAEAEVVEVGPSGQLRVAAGPLKLTTRIDEVRAASRGLAPASSRISAAPRPRPEFDAAADADVPMQTTDNTIDLRGLRQHEALGMAEQFLDRCLGAGRRVAFLIHGHGTGALRDGLRQALRSSSYVARIRPGELREGGDGVTVVWLR